MLPCWFYHHDSNLFRIELYSNLLSYNRPSHKQSKHRHTYGRECTDTFVGSFFAL